VSTLDSKIDDLYQRPLDEFIEARAALASQLKGDEARQIKQLKKPTAVPWAVNQVYWQARPVFDRVLTSGKALRLAQIAALEGRSADVRGATTTHRDAVAAAVTKAIEIAGAAKLQPGRDALAQTFDALSLAPARVPAIGRLTQPLHPGGFEMLSGVEPAPQAPRGKPSPVVARPAAPAKPTPAEERAAARARERELEAAARQRAAAIKAAEAALAQARSKEAEAERAWRQAQEDVETARRALRNAQS